MLNLTDLWAHSGRMCAIAPANGETLAEAVPAGRTVERFESNGGGCEGVMPETVKHAVIILVDDDAPSRYLNGRILREAGYEVREVTRATEALELLAQERPDLIILDMQLPGMSGSELLRRIRSDPVTGGLPAMYLSATFADEASIAYGLEGGADAYLVKPVSPVVLLAQVRALLRLGRMYDELSTARQEAERRAEALRESNRRTVEVLESIRDGFLSVDRNWRFTYVNARAAQNVGSAPGDLIGRDLWEMFPSVLGTPHEANYRRAMEERVPVEFEMPGVLTGSWYHIRAYPSADGISVYWIDITARKQAEEAQRESEERYRSLFENMLDGYAYCRMIYEDGTPQDFIYLDVNSAFERLTGLRGVVGKRISEVIPDIRQTNPEVLEIYGRVARGGGPERFEVYLEALGAWLSIAVYSPAEGYFVAVFDNITARKGAEERLLEAERTRARMAETLADEIAHRTRNDLAIVAALLQTQLDHQADRPLAPGLVRDAIARIHAFVALHEQMYQTQGEEVELVSALRRMADLDRRALAAESTIVSVEGEPVSYPSRVGTTLCVVANELVMNALRHGASDSEARHVEIRVWTEAGSLHIAVWSSGAPIAAGFEVAKEARTGLDLVHTVVEDHYGGTFRLTPERGGTRAEIVIDEARLREE